jgi:plastocyanin
MIAAALLAIKGAPDLAAATVQVRAGDFFFNPTNVTILVGDTILWTNVANRNHDSTHNPSSGSALWARPASDMVPRDTFSFTFSNPGNYPYVCAQHVQTFPQQTGLVRVVSQNFAPMVALTNPANNITFGQPATLLLQAAASDSDGSVTQVQFFANATLLGSDATPPFQLTVSNLLAGAYALTAQARDSLGARSTSAPVNITVTQPLGGVTNVVTVGDTFFDPPLLTINAGDTVIWRNQGVLNHTATGNPGSSEALCGSTFLRGAFACTNRFLNEGSFPYFCLVHPLQMQGTVVVVRPLILSAPRFTPQGEFQFDYSAIPGGVYEIRRSPSAGTLVPQLSFATNIAASNLVTVTDSNILPNRAYSVRRVQ